MLTCPSDPLPQVVCPMDEVTIPQNHFCSAPPHSEPSPPLPFLSSITPSCYSSANNGISGSGSSDGTPRVPAESSKKHSTADTEAAPNLQNLSLCKRQGESEKMVPTLEAIQPRRARAREVTSKDAFDADLAPERQNQQKNSHIQMNISPAEDGITDMETCGESAECDAPSVPPPNQWVIGPLFQSLKSKISSFTEIVMTPVKVFRASSSLPPSAKTESNHTRQASGASNIQHSDLSGVVDSQAQGESGTEDTDVTEGADKAQTVVHRCCKKLNLDSKPVDEHPTAETVEALLDFVPLRQCPSPCLDSEEGLPSMGSLLTSGIPLRPPVAIGVLQDLKLKMPSVEEELKGQPLLRKGAATRKKVNSKTSDPETVDVQLPLRNPLSSAKDNPRHDDTVLSEPNGMKKENNLQSYLSDGVSGGILGSTSDNQPPEAPLIAETRPARGHRRGKRDLKWGACSQDSVKRKRVTSDECSINTRTQELQRERPTRKRQALSASANKRGKTLTTLHMETEPFEADRVPSLDSNGGGSEESWKGSGGKAKPKKTRPLKTQTCLRSADVASDNIMDIETTIAISSTERTPPKRLVEVLRRPRAVHSTRRGRESSRNPQKRKSPTHFSSDSENSTKALELLEVRTDLAAIESFLDGRCCKVDLKELSNRPKKALGPSLAEGSRETKKLKTKENRPQGSRGKMSVSPVYFEMTPSDSSHPAAPLLDCYVRLGQDIKLPDDGRAKPSDAAVDEPFPTNNGTADRSCTGTHRRLSKGARPRKDKPRRKCRALLRRRSPAEEVAISQDDSSLASAGARASGQLLRSRSCPEISTLRFSDTPWAPPQPPHHARVQPPQQHARPGPHLPHPAHKSVRRARRHTVCSVEVEREIAPLCLRKEVYPSRRSGPYDSCSLSPSASPGSLSALASCFLSSPLAYLSKKDSRGAPASPGASAHVSSPTSSLFVTLNPSTRHLSGLLQQPDSSGVITGPSGIAVQSESGRGQRGEADDDGENTSSSSQEFEDAGLREEKALSDSEVKVMHKHGDRGKVSSIRIRKALPKPQNNLTPMGLPKAVRVKKKDFSLEEIYTNKNFNKPRESRLETIFEDPVSRKNGAVSSFGQKRIRRFLEFLEVGEARKPKKPLVGVGKAGAPTSRTRRGTFPKEASPLSAQDVDSLLCAKLDQLSLWLIQDQSDG